MRALLCAGRYAVLVAVVCCCGAALVALCLGAIETLRAVIQLIQVRTVEPGAAVQLIQIMDFFLLAMGLVVLGLGIYELFNAPLELPEWMRVRHLDDLKSKLASILILVMTVAFLEHLVEWRNARDTLLHGIAVGVVGALLLAFLRLRPAR